jgi:hypothetical protein
MFVEEARWIRRQLESLPLQAGDRVLDIGSSTREFRTVEQPHIEHEIFAPLNARGIHVVHMDAKQDDGVDVVCNIADPSDVPLGALDERFQVVICANLLEHVTDRPAVAARVAQLVAEHGYLVVTVPRVYRYHADPIDTHWRPTPDEVTKLFRSAGSSLELTTSEVLSINDWRYYAPCHHWWLFPLDCPTLLRYALKTLRWRQSCVVLRHL